jgi:site-specific DNA recombinase
MSKNAEGVSELKIDYERAKFVVQVFELVASRSYTLEEVLRRITLLGFKTRRGRALTKQTLSRMLRNPIYAGWVVSGENKIKGLHEPLIAQELFDDVQNALDGKTSAPVVHKKINEDFPLKGFVMCSACGKKLTAGFVKGRKEKYPRYWCWNPKCTVRVSASRDEIEGSFLAIARASGDDGTNASAHQ